MLEAQTVPNKITSRPVLVTQHCPQKNRWVSSFFECTVEKSNSKVRSSSRYFGLTRPNGLPLMLEARTVPNKMTSRPVLVPRRPQKKTDGSLFILRVHR